MEYKSYQLEKKLLGQPASFWETSVYLFIGEESYLKEDLLSTVMKKLKVPRDGAMRLDAATLSGEEIFSSLNTAQLSDERVIIIVENADKIPADTCQSLYNLWEKNGFPEDSLPVFIAQSVTNRKLWGLVKEEGIWCKFYQMFSDGVPRWTLNKMQQAGIKAERGVEFIISSLCNLNLRHIAKEVEKLAIAGDYLTADNIKNYIRGTESYDRSTVEDSFMGRDLIRCRTLLGKLIEVGDNSVRDFILSFSRITRHAIQAKYSLDNKVAGAPIIANLGGQLLGLTAGDWNTISKKIEVAKQGSSLVDKIPMAEKMRWTGKLSFIQEAQDEPSDADEGTDKKGRRKLLTYDVDKEKRLAEIEAQKALRKWEETELYNHNIWYQKSVYGILKTFHMATVYTKDELSQMLATLLKINESLYYQGEFQMQEKLDCLLIKLMQGKCLKA